MLVLSRKQGQEIIISDTIVVTVTEIRGGRVKVSIEAAKEIHVRRGELERKEAA